MISGFGTFLPLYMRSHGHSFFLSGATTTVFLSIGSIGALISGHFAPRVDRRRIIMFSVLGAMPLLLSFIYFSGPIALLALAVSGVLLYFSFPLNIVMAQELFPRRASTIAALMIGLSWGTAGLLMTPVGYLAEKIGLQNALMGLAVCGVLAASAAWFLPEDNVRFRRQNY
jgi:FSR family fosmidomycin resistance protein-like MFS transporter